MSRIHNSYLIIDPDWASGALIACAELAARSTLAPARTVTIRPEYAEIETLTVRPEKASTMLGGGPTEVADRIFERVVAFDGDIRGFRGLSSKTLADFGHFIRTAAGIDIPLAHISAQYNPGLGDPSKERLVLFGACDRDNDDEIGAFEQHFLERPGAFQDPDGVSISVMLSDDELSSEVHISPWPPSLDF